jgi:hypothetical protein
MVNVDDPKAAKPEDGRQKRDGADAGKSGREKSKANSFQHGLRAKIVFSDEMARAIRERTRMLEEQFRPQSEYEDSLIQDMAIARVKLDRIADWQVANADRVVDRARDFWDLDQRERALKLLRRLPKDPPMLSHKLAAVKQGALLLIERWEGLSRAALTAGDWDDAQRGLALDMLGTALELRPAGAALPAAGDKQALAALAEREIARLRTAVETVLARQDARDRADTMAGLRLPQDDESRLLRSYEAAARRDYNRAHTELKRVLEEAELFERDEDEDEGAAEGFEARCEAGPTADSTPTASEATPTPSEAPAPADPEQPPADEPVASDHGRPTSARELMKELREAAEAYARERRHKGA